MQAEDSAQLLSDVVIRCPYCDYEGSPVALPQCGSGLGCLEIVIFLLFLTGVGAIPAIFYLIFRKMSRESERRRYCDEYACPTCWNREVLVVFRGS
jgi:hypothetical protein